MPLVCPKSLQLIARIWQHCAALATKALLLLRNSSQWQGIGLCPQGRKVAGGKVPARAPGTRHTHLKLVLLPVDDDSSDLLVHEDENGHQQGRDGCCQVHPPRVPSKRWDKPTPLRTGWLRRARKRKLVLEAQYRGDDVPKPALLPAMELQGDTSDSSQFHLSH